jgi:hypothetical protein
MEIRGKVVLQETWKKGLTGGAVWGLAFSMTDIGKDDRFDLRGWRNEMKYIYFGRPLRVCDCMLGGAERGMALDPLGARSP